MTESELQELLERANKGDASAQCSLGFMYEKGYGIDQDYEKAVELYQQDADQGNAVAKNNLGWMYQNGFGVKQDYKKAAELYRKSADQGNEYAIANLKELRNQKKL